MKKNSSALLFIFTISLICFETQAWNPKAFQAPSKKELKQKLTPMQYKVTQQNGTEPPFKNEYLEEKREGIYVDVVSGEPLFSSADKFDSGTGWPSFTRPLDKNFIVEKEDRSLFSVRTEVRSRYAHSHLGHVFNDGPKPTGLRYCLNSASLRFVPMEEMEQQGYGKYLGRIAEAGKGERAVFSGGCFWCMEPPFEKLKGVQAVTAGYAGGKEENPTYEAVSAAKTGHLEAVEVVFDPSVVSYEELLEVFWKNVDPFDGEGQFCDKGAHYRAAIFFPPKRQAEVKKSLAKVEKQLKKRPATLLLPLGEFYPAEDYHQDYYKKNPVRYSLYRLRCGRDKRLKEVWK